MHIAILAAIAVSDLIGLHRNIRRLRHDTVERHPANRNVEIARSRHDVIAAVQAAIEVCEIRGARRNIGRPNPASKTRLADGRDAGSGSQIEQRLTRRLR